MNKSTRRMVRETLDDDQGIILVIAMLILLALTAMGTSAIMTSTIETKISGNDLLMKQAFYSADAGSIEGMEWLSTQGIPPGTTAATTYEVKTRGDGDGGNDYGGIDYDGELAGNYYRYDMDYLYNRMVAGSSTNYREFYYDLDSQGDADRGASSEVEAKISRIYRVDY